MSEKYSIGTKQGKRLDKDEIARLVELFRHLDEAEQGYDTAYGLDMREPSDNGIRRWLSGSRHLVTARDADGKIVGFASNDNTGDYKKSRFVRALSVDPDYRNQGIGRTILEHIIRENRRRKLRTLLRVSLNNPAGLHLYSSLGFVPTNQIMLHKEDA